MVGLNNFKFSAVFAEYKVLKISERAPCEPGLENTSTLPTKAFRAFHILLKRVFKKLVFSDSILNFPLFIAKVLNCSAINSSFSFLVASENFTETLEELVTPSLVTFLMTSKLPDKAPILSYKAVLSFLVRYN